MRLLIDYIYDYNARMMYKSEVDPKSNTIRNIYADIDSTAMHMTLFADFRKLRSRHSLLAIDGVDSCLKTFQKTSPSTTDDLSSR